MICPRVVSMTSGPGPTWQLLRGGKLSNGEVKWGKRSNFAARPRLLERAVRSPDFFFFFGDLRSPDFVPVYILRGDKWILTEA
jgi:hypothetical protein